MDAATLQEWFASPSDHGEHDALLASEDTQAVLQ
jgi:hypothetical protein